MKFSINRESLLKPLQLVSGAIERRHTLPILANVLIEVGEDSLTFIGTDLEVELVATSQELTVEQAGKVTVPAKKMMDIVRGLPSSVDLVVEQIKDNLVIKAGRSKYTLSTLPAADFPNLEEWTGDVEFMLQKDQLRQLIENTHFSMANQDVRYYLNGMSIETGEQRIRAVATDGHRLAMSQFVIDSSQLPSRQVIVPRKAVLEILRLVESDETLVTVQLGSNHVRLVEADFVFTSKLVDGRFPDYKRVLPREGDKVITANREDLKSSLARAAILSNEKFRGVRLNVENGEMKITANNPEQEEAVEIVEVQYADIALELGFNVSYILEVLNTLKCEEVTITLTDANSSALIEGTEGSDSIYVVMPMRL